MITRTIHTFALLVALAVLGLTACAPPLTTVPTATATQEVIKPVTEDLEVEPELKQAASDPESQTKTPAAPTPGRAASVEDLQDRLTALYRKANPSVVFILVSRGGTNAALGRGSGTGWVYGTDGTIVTNDHVVDAGTYYEIVFPNGDRMEADLIGADPDSDLAVLQVEALPEGVEPLPLGDSGSLEVGQFAVAIGNPFGEQSSMSWGIISGLDRSLPSQRSTTSGSTYSLPAVVQTDAPINPGNSGGPLLNLEGEVIGVNAAIASDTLSNSGVGFSIPVDVVKRVVPSLIADGEVTYPYMGVSFDGEISLPDLEIYGISQTRGAYVIEVLPGSPADDAGLTGANPETGRGGDLIVAIDGRPIDDFSDLNRFLVLEAEVGQTIDLTVIRDGDTVNVALTLGTRP
jgi:2-alkenal reductase